MTEEATLWDVPEPGDDPPPVPPRPVPPRVMPRGAVARPETPVEDVARSGVRKGATDTSRGLMAEKWPTRMAQEAPPLDIPEDAPPPDDRPVVGQGVMFADLEAERRLSARDLTTRFGVPPFSVLRSDAGYWQQRKAEWLALGIQSELGRGEARDGSNVSINLAMDTRGKDGKPTWRKEGGGLTLEEHRMRKGALPTTGSAGVANVEMASRRAADRRSNLTGAAPLPDYADNGTEYIAPGTSIFDPVLCELIYRWWLPWEDGRTPIVLDPFAGGSVRGIVAGMLGAQYVGIDLSRQQVHANAQQGVAILGPDNPLLPAWIVGDSRNIRELAQPSLDILAATPSDAGRADMVFSCPPYYDLEVYSDDPADLSRASTYDDFLEAQSEIIGAALSMLAPDRFAVWVTGEIRDTKTGMQRGLVADTIRTFRDHGAHLYNEAVLVTPTGTLALRAPRQFNAGRKLGRSHQSVLVFWRGEKGPKGWAPVQA